MLLIKRVEKFPYFIKQLSRNAKNSRFATTKVIQLKLN